MKQLRLIAPFVLFALACSDPTGPASPPVTSAPNISANAHGDDGGGGVTRCVGTLPPGTYRNIVVPRGATCVLENSIVLENVLALEGARLRMFNDQVGGNVLGVKTAAMEIFAFPLGAGTVGENIHIHGGNSPEPGLPTVFVNNIEILRGNVHIENNNANEIFFVNNTLLKGSAIIQRNTTVFTHNVRDNRIAQQLLVFGNGGPSPKAVQSNFVGGSLICFRNAAPFAGGPNSAQRAFGQCF